MSWLRRYWPFLWLALIPVVPLWRAVFLGEGIGPFDQIRHMAPWNGPKPAVPWDVLQADGVLQFYVWRDLVFDAWGKGQLPLWNPYQMAGMPLLADSQSAGFYPPHILLGVLHVPTVAAMTLLAWIHLAWAGIGAYFLGRRLGASRTGAVVGASSFSMSAFLLAWTALPSVPATVAWIPWVLALVVSLFDSEHKGAPRTMAALAACTGMMLLAGHLQFAAYGLMAATLLAVALAVSQRTSWAGKRLGIALLTLLVGGAASAPQMLPVLQYGQFSHRRNSPTAEGYKRYVDPSIKPFDLANLASTKNLGDPRAPVGFGSDAVSQYWPPFVKQGANFAESALTIGPLVLILLFLAPWKEKRMACVGIVGVVALLLALGSLLDAPLYYLVPGWSSSGSPGRAIALFVLTACVCAGPGVDRLLTWDRKKLLTAAGGAILLGLILARLMPSLAPAPGERSSTVVDTLASAAARNIAYAVVVAAIAFGAAFARSRYPGRAAWSLLVAAPVLIAVVDYATTLVMTGQPLPRIDAKIGPNERVAIVNSNWSIPIASSAICPPNLASASRVHDLSGYDSLLHRESVAILHDVDNDDPAPPENGNMMLIKPSASPEKLAGAGVTQVWSLRPLPEAFGQPEQANGYLTYRLPGGGRFVNSDGKAIPVQHVDEGYDHLSFDAPPGSLTVKDRNMPGWTDGGAALANGPWRVVNHPRSSPHVDLRYSPPGLSVGIPIGIVAWVLIVLAGAAPFIFRRRS